MKKTVDNIIYEKIFYLDDGIYEIETSIGKLFLSIKQLKDKRRATVVKKDGSIFSKYIKHNSYLNSRFYADYPQNEISDNIYLEYDEENYNKLTIYQNKQQYKIILNDGLELCNYQKGYYFKRANTNILWSRENEGIGIDLDNDIIYIFINDTLTEMKKEEFENKMRSIASKIAKVNKYLKTNAKELSDFIPIEHKMSIGNLGSISLEESINELEHLLKAKEIYLKTREILNYSHDINIKREIAIGLNDYFKDTPNLIDSKEMEWLPLPENSELLKKLLELKIGYHLIETSNSFVQVVVNEFNIEVLNNEDEILISIDDGDLPINTPLSNEVTDSILNYIYKITPQEPELEEKTSEVIKKKK